MKKPRGGRRPPQGPTAATTHGGTLQRPIFWPTSDASCSSPFSSNLSGCRRRPLAAISPRETVSERLLHVLGFACIETEDATTVAQALDWLSKGPAFASLISSDYFETLLITWGQPDRSCDDVRGGAGKLAPMGFPDDCRDDLAS